MTETISTNIHKIEYRLQFTLLSDATFGRGDGIAGLVNEEIEHDRFGLPFVRGRMLKGLLNEECANILYTLSKLDDKIHKKRWRTSASRLFGEPGSGISGEGWLRFGNATLPPDICAAVRHEIQSAEWAKEDSYSSAGRENLIALNRSTIIESMTAIRRQTMLNEEGVPVTGSLRSMRVLLRQTTFESRLVYQPRPQDVTSGSADDDLALLAATVKGWRRGGTGRNRGRGRLQASLLDVDGNDLTAKGFTLFANSLYPQRKEKSA